MSTECERVFSSAKKLITPERNQLGEDIIEACECLKGWGKNSLVEQQFGHFKKQKQKAAARLLASVQDTSRKVYRGRIDDRCQRLVV
jgi:hypothetical protein